MKSTSQAPTSATKCEISGRAHGLDVTLTNVERADVFNALGKALLDQLRCDEAIDAFKAAIGKRPDFPEACLNLACAYLTSGDYAKGWGYYEWRWKTKMGPRFGFTEMNGSHWSGNGEIIGRRVFLHAEQGLGDTLQFCRYARLLVEMGARVVLQVTPPLFRLIRDQFSFGEVIEQGSDIPAYDCHCPLMSLPRAFRTTMETIPYGRAGYLRALPEDAVRWRERLGKRERLRVGLVWSGGLHADTPYFRAVNARRNVSLDLLVQYLDIDGIDFFSLQKGDPEESRILGREQIYWRKARFINLTGDIKDFADTAGLIDNLDIVVAVDTSVAHLAAALGKPTWILNRYDTCWRWLCDREDSPWYGSARLFRQGREREWAPVLERVAAELTSLC